jgi:hypothetical protein
MQSDQTYKNELEIIKNAVESYGSLDAFLNQFDNSRLEAGET